MQNLVIVESPTKARTLSKFLGSEYHIEASMGHIRDLPKADIGVDVADNFEPHYIIPKDKVKVANNLKKIASQAKILWLATDPDREGEAIAWHIGHLIQDKSSKKDKNSTQIVKRVVFHEITPEAIQEAFKHPRDIDEKLVDAQQARRILDRLVGYKLSPLLWKKIKSGLSAGRVQSVALRLIVEREREIQAFKAVEYWSIHVDVETTSGKKSHFIAEVIEKNDKKLEVGNESQAKGHVTFLESAAYQIKKVTKKETKRSPAPPFTTSTLQQTASNKLGFTAKKIMSIAQFLYEHGLITYMRTDSVNLAPVAINGTRDYIASTYGKEFVPIKPRIYVTKSKSAQEAHEAIRPTNMKLRADEIRDISGVTRDHIRLYDLIWKRMLACQMADAVMDQTIIDVDAKKEGTADKYLARARGSIVKFEGWLKVYGVKKESDESEEAKEAEDEEQVLPEVTEQERLNLLQVLPAQHFTEPPARYNDASLIKKLEELGIGRPSTYAPILSTIQERFYIERENRRLVPTALGFAVVDFLVKNFDNIVDYSFTAQMENNLDEIADGQRKWKPTIAEFYGPFEKKLEQTGESAEKVQIVTETVDKLCPQCSKNLQIKFGRFGKFLACTGFPGCNYTENFEIKVDALCPNDGGEIVMRKTKKGRPFYGCKNWPKCTYASWTKPAPPKRTGESVQSTETQG
jgi:DNA topoisomerase I